MSMLVKILNGLFPKTLDSIKRASFADGCIHKENEKVVENKELHLSELKRLKDLGPVIILCNEWNNPIVGKILNIKEDRNASGYVCEVYDYLSGETVESLNTMIPFTLQKLEILDKLDPDDVCALFFEGRHSAKEIYKNPDIANTPEERYMLFTNFSDWIERLSQRGFFIEFPQFKGG